MSDKKRKTRKAKTERGATVVEKVTGAAERLLQDHWLSDVSVSALAEEAGVVRASLFLQFEGGWPDVAATMVDTLLFQEFDRILVDRLVGRSKRDPEKSIVAALQSFVTLADKSGRLVPNLRSQMYVWGSENDEIFHLPSQDYSEQLTEVIALAVPPNSELHRAAAEVLINFSLDMAGGVGMCAWSSNERKNFIRRQVSITLAGLSRLVAEGSD